MYAPNFEPENGMGYKTIHNLEIQQHRRDTPIPNWIKDRLDVLRNIGAIEKVGRKYILSRQFYRFVGKKGVYTRKRGLDRETNKALLLRHIRDNRVVGSRLGELKEVLPALSHNQLQKLLAEMKREGSIYVVGRTRAALWYPGTD